MIQRHSVISNQRGVSAVEFALILPVFVVFLFGMINCGLLLWTQLGMEHGVVAAARCAAINPSTCPDVPAYATQQAYGLDLPKTAFTLTTPACGDQVAASYGYQFVTLLLPPMNLTLTARSCYPT